MTRGIIAAALAFAAAACKAPPPRIPTQEQGNLHISVIGTERASNDRFHGTYSVYGIETSSISPGTGGWGWDGTVRFGSTDGQDQERITNPNGGPSGRSVAVDTDRETDIYELSIGTRQTYFLDSSLQPYFGVGGSIFKTHNSDHYTGTDPDDGLPIDQRKHFQTVAWGLYGRTGLVWSVLRDQLGDHSEFVVGFDLRGLLGDEFSYGEASVVIGFGR